MDERIKNKIEKLLTVKRPLTEAEVRMIAYFEYLTYRDESK